MAATMPSIMPLGATMSAPARGVAHRDPAQDLEGGVVVHGLAAQHAAVAVAGVLAAADVGDQQQIGVALAQPAERALHDAVLGEVLGPDVVLRGREPEENDRRDAERLDPVHLAVERFVHRQVVDARHRVDLALDPLAVDHEDGLDEIAGSQLVLAHQAAQGLGAAAAAGALDRGGSHEGKTRERGHPLQPRETSRTGTRHGGCRFSIRRRPA